jgi:hypothetical protein
LRLRRWASRAPSLRACARAFFVTCPAPALNSPAVRSGRNPPSEATRVPGRVGRNRPLRRLRPSSSSQRRTSCNGFLHSRRKSPTISLVVCRSRFGPPCLARDCLLTGSGFVPAPWPPIVPALGLRALGGCPVQAPAPPAVPSRAFRRGRGPPAFPAPSARRSAPPPSSSP